MALDVSNAGATRRHLELQQRLWQVRHPSMQPDTRRTTARRLFLDIRKYLIKSANAKLLDGGEHDIHRKLKFFEPRENTFAIAVGDRRNFGRKKDLPHFCRTSDRGWFDFQLQLAERDGGVDILAYDFELRLTDESFVRFDLNPPGHGNEDLGLRSHMHVSSDDDGMSVPAPVMSPFELLDLMVHGLVKTGRVRRQDLAELSGQG